MRERGMRSEFEMPKKFSAEEIEKSVLTELSKFTGTAEERKNTLLVMLRERGQGLLPGDPIILENLIARIREMPLEDDRTFAHDMSELFAEVIAYYYSPEDLQVAAHRRERYIRENARGDAGKEQIILSPEHMLVCDAPDGTVVRIHIRDAETLSLEAKTVDFTTGMRALAEKLQNDPVFSAVENIEATSWIVAKGPRMMKRFGFTVQTEPLDEETMRHFVGEDRPVGKASMTKEEVILRYGSKE